MQIEVASYDHPDARKLIDDVQQEYVVRYGHQDASPIDVAEFVAPRGLFLLGYRNGQAVASGAWRAHSADEPGFQDGDAEIKRMYVAPQARGLGLARMILAELERTAAEAGHQRLVLETGLAQPEAIGLYRSAGYEKTPKFGVYACEPDSRCFAKDLTE